METQKKNVPRPTSAALIALALVGLILASVFKLSSLSPEPDNFHSLYSSGPEHPGPTPAPATKFHARVEVLGTGAAKQVDVEILTRESGKQTFTNQTLPFTKSFSVQDRNQIAVTVKNISETGAVHVTLFAKEQRGPFSNSDSPSSRGNFCSGGGCSVAVSFVPPGKFG